MTKVKGIVNRIRNSPTIESMVLSSLLVFSFFILSPLAKIFSPGPWGRDVIFIRLLQNAYKYFDLHWWESFPRHCKRSQIFCRCFDCSFYTSNSLKSYYKGLQKISFKITCRQSFLYHHSQFVFGNRIISFEMPSLHSSKQPELSITTY